MSTLGSFESVLEIDGHCFNIEVHACKVMELKMMMIVGNNILEDGADIRFSNKGIAVCKTDGKTRKYVNNINGDNKLNEERILMTIEINEDQCLQVDPRYEKKIEKLKQDYKPKKNTAIKAKIILKDETPIFHRPRRLASKEKEELTTQLSTWLKESIIQESSSEFSSPVWLLQG